MSTSEIQKLEQTITALEAQRSVLGDTVVDTAVGPLREKLQALRGASSGSLPVPAVETQQRKIVTVCLPISPVSRR